MKLQRTLYKLSTLNSRVEFALLPGWLLFPLERVAPIFPFLCFFNYNFIVPWYLFYEKHWPLLFFLFIVGI